MSSVKPTLKIEILMGKIEVKQFLADPPRVN